MIVSMNNKTERSRFLQKPVAVACALRWASRSPAIPAHPSRPKRSRSRSAITIAKEMNAAQKALQATQWQEALKKLDAAEQKSGLTPFDKKTIYDFKGFADVKLEEVQGGGSGLRGRDGDGPVHAGRSRQDQQAAVPGRRAAISNTPKQSSTASKSPNPPTQRPTTSTSWRKLYYLQKDCKNTVAWADKSIAAAKQGRRDAEGEHLPVQAAVRLRRG